MGPPLRLVTWNILGSRQPDLDAVHALLMEAEPDVVVLQEVQRRQAKRIARRAGWSWTWRYKHFPVVRLPEGQAVLSRLPHRAAPTIVLGWRALWFSWRRRIAVVATVPCDGITVRIVNVHLASGDADAERVGQVGRLLAGLGGDGPVVVAGDLNAEPGSAVFAALHEAGFTDGAPVHRTPTNWARRSRTGAPTQHLDHVLVAGGLTIQDVSAPGSEGSDLDRYRTLSDHVPVVADVRPAPPG